MINEKLVKDYFIKWSGGNKEFYSGFISLLQRKAHYALSSNNKIYAYDKLYTGKELEQMLAIADDMVV